MLLCITRKEEKRTRRCSLAHVLNVVFLGEREEESIISRREREGRKVFHSLDYAVYSGLELAVNILSHFYNGDSLLSEENIH